MSAHSSNKDQTELQKRFVEGFYANTSFPRLDMFNYRNVSGSNYVPWPPAPVVKTYAFPEYIDSSDNPNDAAWRLGNRLSRASDWAIVNALKNAADNPDFPADNVVLSKKAGTAEPMVDDFLNPEAILKASSLSMSLPKQATNWVLITSHYNRIPLSRYFPDLMIDRDPVAAMKGHLSGIPAHFFVEGLWTDHDGKKRRSEFAKNGNETFSLLVPILSSICPVVVVDCGKPVIRCVQNDGGILGLEAKYGIGVTIIDPNSIIKIKHLNFDPRA